ncbi:MAG: hypothetical protein ACI3XR_04110 [Eubacteriales bacterium]
MKMERNQKMDARWIPPAVSLILALLALIAYTLMKEDREIVMYVQVTASALAAAILPVLSVLTKKDFPVFLDGLFAVHIFLASDLGSAMGFYDRFDCWDLIMHGFFGFVAAVTLYTFMLRWNGAKLNRAGFLVLIFLGVMGCAAVWEMFEYVSDFLLGGDAQRVKEALELGISPIKDTMTDIIVTVVGVLAFYAGLYVDKRCKYRVSKRIYEKAADGSEVGSAEE